MSRLVLLAALCAVQSWCSAATSLAGEWSINPVGRFEFTAASVRELSGLSWAGDQRDVTRYYAVSDEMPVLVTLSITVDPASGAATAASAVETIELADPGRDQEGVGFQAATSSVFIANEDEPGIRQHDAATGKLLHRVDSGSHDVLGVWKSVAPNRALESLAVAPDGSSIWTANEEALTIDPPGTVRLQRFDGALKPTGQYAYEISKRPESWVTTVAFGVVDLLILPDGKLVAMERGFGATTARPEVCVRLFEIDLAGAADLAGGPIGARARVGKKLLWEGIFNDFRSNFEGAALGPKLNDGAYSLLLITDNSGTTTTHSLFALRLTAVPPEAP